MLSKSNYNISIIGNNIIQSGFNLSALYIIPGFDYGIMSNVAVENHIENIYRVFSTMFSQNKELKFVLSTIQVPFTKEETLNNLRKSIHKWSKEDVKIQECIKSGSYNIYVLEVFLEIGANLDQEMSLTEIFKSAANNIFKGARQDIQTIFEIEERVSRLAGLNSWLRADRDITFRYILNQYYPGYIFPIDLKGMDYRLLLKVMNNSFEFNPGNFITTNESLSLIGIKPMQKYCSILNFNEMPQQITDNTIDLGLDTKVFVKISDQLKLKTKVKRKMSDIEYTYEQNRKAGGNNEIEKDESRLELAERIVYRIDAGELGCEAAVIKIITGDSKEELNDKKKKAILKYAQSKIYCNTPINQQDMLKQYFLNRNMVKYDFLCDLRYMLSLKIDNFSNVGDFDSVDGIGLTRIGIS